MNHNVLRVCHNCGYRLLVNENNRPYSPGDYIESCENCGLMVCSWCREIHHQVPSYHRYRCRPVADPTLALSEGGPATDSAKGVDE